MHIFRSGLICGDRRHVIKFPCAGCGKIKFTYSCLFSLNQTLEHVQIAKKNLGTLDLGPKVDLLLFSNVCKVLGAKHNLTLGRDSNCNSMLLALALYQLTMTLGNGFKI